MTDQAIQQNDVNNAAWAACDTFRGVMDAAGYKDYILVLLFLKYISDVWQDHYQTYRQKYRDKDTRIRRMLARERFILPKGASYYDLYERRAEPNIGEQINIALDAIETANKSKLEGVFRNIDFNSEANLGQTKDRNRRLKMVLEDFHKPQLDMRPSRISEDLIGNVYIYLIERFASDAGKKAGEFSKQSLEKLAVNLPPVEQQRQAVEFFRLSMQEQRLLEEIKIRKATCAQKILMGMASEFGLTASNKKLQRNCYHIYPGKLIQTQGISTMTRGKNQHVVKHQNGWAVIGDGNPKPTKVTPTQKEAIKRAEQIARNQNSDTKIHGRDGRIRAGNSYGNDPHPPKDEK